MNFPQPKFTPKGTYQLRGDRNKLAACIAALRCIAACRQAYSAQGPEHVAKQMDFLATDLLARLQEVA